MAEQFTQAANTTLDNIPTTAYPDGEVPAKKWFQPVVGDVAITGSFQTMRSMVGGTKTATGVASEAFAGGSRLANRRGLAIKNEHPYLRLRLDGPAVTDTTGIALEPFAMAIFAFDPTVDVPVYVLSEAGKVTYGVVEW